MISKNDFVLWISFFFVCLLIPNRIWLLLLSVMFSCFVLIRCFPVCYFVWFVDKLDYVHRDARVHRPCAFSSRYILFLCFISHDMPFMLTHHLYASPLRYSSLLLLLSTVLDVVKTVGCTLITTGERWNHSDWKSKKLWMKFRQRCRRQPVSDEREKMPSQLAK